DLVEVEVLQAQAVARQHLRYRNGWRHQQPFAMDEVDRRNVRVAQVAQYLVAMRRGPLVGRQQAGRGAVGERGRVGRSQRAAAGGAVERRLQRRQLLQRAVGTQVVIARDAAEAYHQVVEESALVGGGQLQVRRQRPLVLRI